jgi:hypothetical protein
LSKKCALAEGTRQDAGLQLRSRVGFRSWIDSSPALRRTGLFSRARRLVTSNSTPARRMQHFQGWHPENPCMRASAFIEPCLPSPAERPPSGPDWIHEIKLDGFRMMVRRDPAGVRLLTRNGYDWTGRFPRISAAAEALRARSFLIDGEAVACDGDGVSPRGLAEALVQTGDLLLKSWHMRLIDRKELYRASSSSPLCKQRFFSSGR